MALKLNDSVELKNETFVTCTVILSSLLPAELLKKTSSSTAHAACASVFTNWCTDAPGASTAAFVVSLRQVFVVEEREAPLLYDHGLPEETLKLSSSRY